MAQIKNNRALVASDGALDYFKVDTVANRVDIFNNAQLRMFSDQGSTQTMNLSGGTIAKAVSSSAPAIGNGATITTAGVGVARVAPAGAVTGNILEAGTVNGQEVIVLNESTAANSVTFAASGTSNVASGTSAAIAGLVAAKFVWNTSTNLWYKVA